MAKLPTLSFSALELPKTAKGTVVLLLANDTLPAIAKPLDEAGRLTAAIKLAQFSGKQGSTFEVVAPGGGFDRVVVVGTGPVKDATEDSLLRVGGKVFAVAKNGAPTTVLVPAIAKGPELNGSQIATIAMGIKLGAYDFDDYKTKKKNGDAKKPATKFVIATAEATAARRAWKEADGIADGVILARNLVNEPANMLGPVEFAAKAKALEKLGVKVEVLTEREMKRLKMGALLGVNQGSARPPRLAIMKWMNGKAKEAPVAFIGKGVVFDTGGISLKPAGGMEDMKGDMGGAAAVTGLMHALAARKAKVNAIGLIGLVENMPDANAQRPGDIVTSMSGQTIEIINTDAEGRLVLADVLWYCQQKYKPKFMINLATLTGAILVALGKNYAGLFSNDDALSTKIDGAGQVTGEKVWRMPLDKDFDKMIDSRFADMKNTGGRYGGSCTAGQFLQRFVNDVPWAHLDVAGTAMASEKNEFNKSWGSGYGVRLLNRLVADHYE